MLLNVLFYLLGSGISEWSDGLLWAQLNWCFIVHMPARTHTHTRLHYIQVHVYNKMEWKGQRTEPKIVSTFNDVKGGNKEQRSCLVYCGDEVTTDFEQ